MSVTIAEVRICLKLWQIFTKFYAICAKKRFYTKLTWWFLRSSAWGMSGSISRVLPNVQLRDFPFQSVTITDLIATTLPSKFSWSYLAALSPHSVNLERVDHMFFTNPEFTKTDFFSNEICSLFWFVLNEFSFKTQNANITVYHDRKRRLAAL